MAIICDPSPAARHLAEAAAEGYIVAGSISEMHRALEAAPGETLLIIGAVIAEPEALQFAASCRVLRPAAGIILVRRNPDVALMTAAVRAGVREVVADGDLAGLSDACRRSRDITRRLSAGNGSNGGRAGKVVTVFAAKGGCGKTTIAVNLAVILARRRSHRTCLVDLDMAFGDVAVTVQADPLRTLADALPMAGHLDQAAAESLLTPYRPGLSMLLAPVGPGEAERIPPQLIAELLPVLRTMFDYVIIDTPAQFSEHVLTAMDFSASQVLLTTPEIPSLKNLRVTLDMLDLLGYPREARSVVLNRSDSRVGLSSHDVERILRWPVAVQVPSSRIVPLSVNSGTPVTVGKPGSAVSNAMYALGRHVDRSTSKTRREGVRS